MKNIINIAAAVLAASAAIATPAAANEVRADVHGGVIWAGDASEATVGVTAGYDYDLGDVAFVGAEISADKVLVDDADIYVGFSGRGGARIGDAGKAFVVGGYTVGEGEDVWHAGAGYEHKLTDMIYLKAEYRHFFSDFADGDQLVGGIGVKF